MKRIFVCLANSKKYFQRCIAGIELAKSTERGVKYQIVMRDANPSWLRPVSPGEHGEVDASLVKHINLLDVVELDVTDSVPNGFQSENVRFAQKKLPVVYTIPKQALFLDRLLTTSYQTLFGNMQSWVHVAQISTLDHSLVLIKPDEPKFSKKVSSSGSPQVRTTFAYNNIKYDLPITDVEFETRFKQNPEFVKAYSNFYFTISLGLEFNAQHYKLVAGIIYF